MTDRTGTHGSGQEDRVAVSVIVPTYRGGYLAEAVASALGQTLQALEVIVVDDGSGADIEALLGTLVHDGRVRVVHQANQGAPAARNAGARLAQGRYLAFLDDDDRWMPTKLELQVAALERHPEAGICCCDGIRTDADGRPTDGFRESKGWIPSGELVVAAGAMPFDVVLKGVVITSSVLIRRDLFEEVGGFALIPSGGEDVDLAFRATKKAGLVSLPDQLFEYRLTPTSVSRSGLRSLLAEEAFALRLFEYDLTADQRRTVEHLLGTVNCNLAYEYFKAREVSAARRRIVAAVVRYGFVTGWSLRVLLACLAPKFVSTALMRMTGRL
jgi:glycosyltransferase involved in cell wall biosynthesis